MKPETWALRLLWALPVAWLLIAVVSGPTLSYVGWVLVTGSAVILAWKRTRKTFVWHVSATVSYGVVRISDILIFDTGRLTSVGVWILICVKSMLIASLAMVIADRERIKYGPVLD